MANNSFAERLTQLRNEKGLKREDVAKALGCSISAVGNYENGNRTPDFDGLVALADLFTTTTDYLLGRTDVKTDDKDLKFICDYTGLSEKAVFKLVEDRKRQMKYNYKVWGNYSYLDLASWFIEDGNLVELMHEIGVYCAFENDVYNQYSLLDDFEQKFDDNKNLTTEEGEHNLDTFFKLRDEIDRSEILSGGVLYKIQRIVTDFAKTVYCEWFEENGGDSNGNNSEEE